MLYEAMSVVFWEKMVDCLSHEPEFPIERVWRSILDRVNGMEYGMINTTTLSEESDLRFKQLQVFCS